MKKMVIVVALAAILATGTAFADHPDGTSGYVERYLFVKDGDTAVKVTYDGTKAEAFPALAEKQAWQWYSYDEYAAHVKNIINLTNNVAGSRARVIGADCDSCIIPGDVVTAAMFGAERDPLKLIQTLTDIKNGIKVSRPITIYTKNGPNVADNNVGWVKWYVYSYSFKDKAGNEVDLGLFETRDGLFNALRQYYDREIAAGRLTKAEADRSYSRVAHGVRNVDEMPLQQKLLNYKKLYNVYL